MVCRARRGNAAEPANRAGFRARRGRRSLLRPFGSVFADTAVVVDVVSLWQKLSLLIKHVYKVDGETEEERSREQSGVRCVVVEYIPVRAAHAVREEKTDELGGLRVFVAAFI